MRRARLLWLIPGLVSVNSICLGQVGVSTMDTGSGTAPREALLALERSRAALLEAREAVDSALAEVDYALIAVRMSSARDPELAQDLETEDVLDSSEMGEDVFDGDGEDVETQDGAIGLLGSISRALVVVKDAVAPHVSRWGGRLESLSRILFPAPADSTENEEPASLTEDMTGQSSEVASENAVVATPDDVPGSKTEPASSRGAPDDEPALSMPSGEDYKHGKLDSTGTREALDTPEEPEEDAPLLEIPPLLDSIRTPEYLTPGAAGPEGDPWAPRAPLPQSPREPPCPPPSDPLSPAPSPELQVPTATSESMKPIGGQPGAP